MSDNAWWSQEETGKDVPEISKVRPKNNKLSILGSVALVTLLTGGLVAGTFAKPNPYAAHPGPYDSIEHPATVRGVVNECGPSFEYNPPARYYGTLPESFFEKKEGQEPARTQLHPMIVPAYGYMAPDSKMPENISHFFSSDSTKVPTKEQVLKLMWDGWTVIWYVPPISDRGKLTAEQLENTFNPTTIEAIKVYAEGHDKVLALPWRESNNLPMGRNMGISAWGLTQSCKVWDIALMEEFQAEKQRLSPTPRRIPPAAQLDDKGEVYPITPNR